MVEQSKVFLILIKNIRIFEFWQPMFGNFIFCETINYNENFHCVKARFLNKVITMGNRALQEFAQVFCNIMKDILGS